MGLGQLLVLCLQKLPFCADPQHRGWKLAVWKGAVPISGALGGGGELLAPRPCLARVEKIRADSCRCQRRQSCQCCKDQGCKECLIVAAHATAVLCSGRFLQRHQATAFGAPTLAVCSVKILLGKIRQQESSIQAMIAHFP